MHHLPVYLDYNATTPLHPEVLDAMMPYFTQHFGNAASSNHLFGWNAHEAVAIAREQAAQLIKASPAEIIFTSGATESVNLAIKGVYEMYAAKGNHIITCCTEHKAVLDTCKHLQKNGADITILSVKEDGIINLDDLENSIKPNTILIAVMYANNETGVLQPVFEIGQIAHKHKVLFFSDATQAVGKVGVNVIDDNIDLLAFNGHKLYGPKGAGALFVRRKSPKVKVMPQIDGGGHENGLRSGTLNVPGIVGLGKACGISEVNLEKNFRKLLAFRNKLETELLSISGSFINGHKINRLPNTCNIGFERTEKNSLLTGLSKKLAVSSGSACTSALPEPSHVLKAMGLTDLRAGNSLRFSIGIFTTEEEIDFAIKAVKKLCEP